MQYIVNLDQIVLVYSCPMANIDYVHINITVYIYTSTNYAIILFTIQCNNGKIFLNLTQDLEVYIRKIWWIQGIHGNRVS